MAEAAQTRTVSRSALLELQEELALVRDGYEFLDEKRILLAAEILRRRDGYREARGRYLEAVVEAIGALTDATSAHGLEGLLVHPAAEARDSRLEVEARPAVGQLMLTATFEPAGAEPPRPAVLDSPEARSCRARFRDLLRQGAALAALSTSLARLAHEFRRTERRVRALENVVVPEIRAAIAVMEDQLELVEQEEVIRVRADGPLQDAHA